MAAAPVDQLTPGGFAVVNMGAGVLQPVRLLHRGVARPFDHVWAVETRDGQRQMIWDRDLTPISPTEEELAQWCLLILTH